MSDDVPRRGELWWCEVPEIGLRPVVVLSRDEAIPRRRRAIIAPCTRTIRGLASEVVLDPEEDPVPHPSAVNLDSVENVSLGLFVSLMGSLSLTRMGEVCAALEVAVDCG
jgi:mRNA interferase MazF